MKDKRVRAAVLIGLLLVLYGRPNASSLIFPTHCADLEPYSWEWFYFGCWWMP